MNELWSRFLNTIEFMFELKIVIEKDYFKLSQEKQKLFYLLTYLQTLSIFLTSVQNSDYESQIINIQANISFITRPHEYLSVKQDTKLYYFLVPLTYYIILIISIVLIKLQYNKTQIQIAQFIQNLNSIVLNYFLVQIFLIMAFQQLLFTFFLELSLISFCQSQDNVTDFIIAGLSMITSLITLSIQMLYIKFENPALFELNLSKFNRSSTDYLQTLIILLIIITNRLELRNQIQIIGFLLQIIYLIRLKDIYFNYDKFYELQRFELITLSYCLCFVLAITLADFRSSNKFEFQTFIVSYVVSFPLIAFILIQIIDDIFRNIIKDQNTISIQNYKLWMINQNINLNKKEQSKFALILYYINFNQNKIDENQVFKYQEVIYQYFVQEIQIFYQIISQTKDQSKRIEYYLQFLKFNYYRQVHENQSYIKLRPSINSTRRTLEDLKSLDLSKQYQININKIFNFNQLSFHENLKLKIMKQSTKNKFLQTNNYDQDEMKKVIQLFMKFEQSNHEIIENIKTAINYKLQYINLFMQRDNQLFQKAHQIVDKLRKIEIKFLNQYQQFPSKKMQTYVIFYFAEIQNDFLNAYKYQNVNTMTDENLIKMQINKSYDLLKENIEYLSLSLDENTNTFDITQYSKGLMDQIIKKNQQKNGLKLDDILPIGFQKIHAEYIERFLISGKSKYFRQFSPAFYVNKEQYLVQVDAVFDILDNSIKPSYIVFLRPQPNNSPIIWVDANLNIAGISKDVNQIFSIPENYLERFREILYSKPIKQLIPKFVQIIDENKSPCKTAIQTEINLKQYCFKGQDQYQYYCDLMINIRQSPSDIKYYLIQIFNFKAVEISYQDNSIINEEPIIYGQLEFNQTQRHIYSGLQMFDTQFNSPKSEKKLLKNYAFDTQREVIQDILYSEDKQLDQINPLIQSHQIIKISSERIIPYQEQFSKVQNLEAFAIQSQESSFTGIKQSKFYKRYEIIHKFMISGEPQQETKIQFILLILILVIGSVQAIIFLGQINNQIRTLQQNIDVLTLKSTFSSAQDSYYICMTSIIYHALQLISQVITPQQYQLENQYSSFRLGNIFQELKQNNKDIMANPSLSQYLSDKQMTIYQKNQFSVDSRNTSVQEALNLFLESSFGFQTLEQILQGQLDSQASYVVFQLANYYTFQNTIEEINQAMKELSIEKAQEFEHNLDYVFFPCLIISFIIIQLRFYFIILRKYEKLNQNQSYDFGQYLKFEIERIKHLTQFVNNDQLNYLDYQFDLNKSEIKLNLIDHELQSKASNIFLKKNNQNLNKKTFIIKRLTISVIFFLLYLSFQLTNYIQLLIYLRKAQLTIKYYDQIQTLQSSSSSLYTSKQLSSQISIKQWSFLNETQRFIALNRYNNSVLNLKEFISNQNEIDLNQLLVSKQYIYEYQRFISTDLCQLIEQPQLIDWFCDTYIGGSLRRGFSTSISAILYSFQTQYVEQDGFSRYVLTNQSELEGGLILESVIGDLCKTIITDIKEYTQSLSNILMIVSVSYLAVYIPICVYVVYWIQKKEDEYFKIALRIISLLPQSYLFLDNQVDRELRQMAVQFNL